MKIEIVLRPQSVGPVLLLLMWLAFSAPAQMFIATPQMQSSNFGLSFVRPMGSNEIVYTYLPVRSAVSQELTVRLDGGDWDTIVMGGMNYPWRDTMRAIDWSASGSLTSLGQLPDIRAQWVISAGMEGMQTVSCTASDLAAPGGNDTDVSVTAQFPLVKVTEVVWEKYHSTNLDLDACPLNGGKRIFPDKLAYDDAYPSRRDRVYVTATITPAIANIPVYFQLWDVDDPSANSGPVDDNAVGPDNRGTASLTASVSTDGSGVARATLIVSMQPGDNFRVVASCYSGAEGLGTQALADAGSDPVDGKMTEALTVWRKLWVEQDSMGAPEPLAEGAYLFDGDAALSGNSTALTANSLSDTTKDWRPGNQLSGGEVDSHTGRANALGIAIGNTISMVTTATGISIDKDSSNQVIPAGSPYAIHLDDPAPGDLPDPELSVTVDAFSECYIDVQTSGTIWDVDNLTFSRDLPGTVIQHRGSGTYEASSFWIVHIMSAYDGSNAEDNDPDGEACLRGATWTSGAECSVVYLEACRDDMAFLGYTGEEVRTICHEIGHQFGLAADTHPSDFSVMDVGGPNQTGAFNNSDKAAIRSIVFP